MRDKYWRVALAIVPAAYCLLALLAILQRPGLQFDEALLVEGAVQMRISPRELALPHDPDTWVCPFGRCFPLMTVRYVGSMKEYLCLPIYAVFSSRVVALRLLSILLGAIGIWGLAILIRQQAGNVAAAITAGILAINPAYLAMTAFDNDAVAMSMAAFGAFYLAVAGYLRNRSLTAGFLAGTAMGFTVWARANLVWALAALAGAAILVLGKRFRLPAAHVAAAIIGGIIGGLPFLVYQFISHGGTWEGLSMFSSNDTLSQRLYTRLVLFSETLLSDREHRAMWDGPSMPAWQPGLFTTVVAMAWSVCLIKSDVKRERVAFRRIAALALLLLAVPLFFSRVQLSEHHLIGLLPLAAVVTVLAFVYLAARHRSAAVAGVILAVVYAGAAIFWQVSAVQGLRRTGGVGPWSDGINSLATLIQEKYPTSEVKILDWGLEYNLFVLTDGKLRTRGIFGGATEQLSGQHRPWPEEIREGGVFVLNARANRVFPVATEGFLRAVGELRPTVQRFMIKRRDGVPFAEVYSVEANTLGTAVLPTAGGVASSITMGDARFAKQLEGFHEIEPGGWRWTKRQFAVTLGAPDVTGGRNTRLSLQLNIPDAVIQRLGPITMNVSLNGHALPPETYLRAGDYTLARGVNAAWLNAASNRIDCSLDKSLAPSSADHRELGVILVSATLQ
jgi:dolichyl-phosphate-mannose-protein mannosyltransferase